jgi:predicted nuclease of predicted toxin-antitoxin system
MKFIADECFFYKAVNFLRKNGYDVKYIIEENRSISDEDICLLAKNENRIILTFDLDFGEIYRFTNFLKRGCIIFRNKPLKSKEIIKSLEKIVNNNFYLRLLDDNALLIVKNNRIRVIE